MIAALAPIFKILLDILASVFSKILLTPTTIDVKEPENAPLETSDIPTTADELLDQHGWLLDS